MRTIKIMKRRPACYGDMYDLPEAEMAERCLSCCSFNDCKKIGGGIKVIPASTLIPEESAMDAEYQVRW